MLSPCCLIFSPFLFKSKLQPQAFLAQLRPPVILFLEIPVLRPKRISSDEKYDYHLLFPSRKIFSFCPPPPPTHPILSTHQTILIIFAISERPHQVTGVFTYGSNEAESQDWRVPGRALTCPDALPLLKFQCEAE